MALTNETLQLRAKAKRAGIPNYGSMSADELRAALAGGKGSKKRKSASTLGKRKSASTVTKRTSSTRKSAKKAPAAKSATSGKAKRSSTGGTRKRSTARKIGTNAKTQARHSTGKPGRNLIDRSAIDWKADWPGGESGNRGIIMKALRRFKGNYAKVYDHLKPQARKMFSKSSKTGERYSADKARAQLRWYIGRTAFDYVTATGQHQKSTNRKPDRRTNGKAAGAAKSTRKSGGTRKSTPKAASRQTGSRKRTAASQRAGGKTRKSTKRKSVKR